MWRLFITAPLCIFWAAPGVAQASEDQQRAACGGNVIRFCFSQIPDRERITECMLGNRPPRRPFAPP